MQNTAREDGDSLDRYGSGVLPDGAPVELKRSPVINYTYARTRPILERLKKAGDVDPRHEHQHEDGTAEDGERFRGVAQQEIAQRQDAGRPVGGGLWMIGLQPPVDRTELALGIGRRGAAAQARDGAHEVETALALFIG